MLYRVLATHADGVRADELCEISRRSLRKTRLTSGPNRQKLKSLTFPLIFTFKRTSN